jgi:hypothetical protein
VRIEATISEGKDACSDDCATEALQPAVEGTPLEIFLETCYMPSLLFRVVVYKSTNSETEIHSSHTKLDVVLNWFGREWNGNVSVKILTMSFVISSLNVCMEKKQYNKLTVLLFCGKHNV